MRFTLSATLLAGLLCTLLPGFLAVAKKPGYLQQCWRQQVQPLRGQCLALTYHETVNELEHNAAPWQATAYTGRGIVWASAEGFLKSDTLTNVARQRTYFSSTQWSPSTLLYRDYGDKDLFAATWGLQQDYIFRAARYAPMALLAYFVQHHIPADKEAGATGLVRYHTTINGTVVTLAIREKDALLAQVALLSNDDLLGDVATTFTYENYASWRGLFYATSIHAAKTNGRLLDEISIGAASIQPVAPALLTAPAGYQLKAGAEPVPVVQATTFRPRIHLQELKHTDDRVLLAEFDHFLVVAEAPLSSQNGELIIREAQKIAPGKPIRYFVFGHHHPHYLGGMRAFVRRGVTVLHGPGDADYVHYLATAPHTLRPDSLQRYPTPLKAEEITDSKTITDGQLTMQILFIGKQSEHTNDYLIYYFPSEKLVFEDDLAQVPRQGTPRPASARQAGLYNAIRARGLNVDVVVQSWPVAESGVKTIIPFTDLTKAMMPVK